MHSPQRETSLSPGQRGSCQGSYLVLFLVVLLDLLSQHLLVLGLLSVHIVGIDRYSALVRKRKTNIHAIREKQSPGDVKYRAK